METALEFEAVGGEYCDNETDEVIIDCAGAGGVERWRLIAAENGDAGEGGVDIGLSNGSGLQNKSLINGQDQSYGFGFTLLRKIISMISQMRQN